MRSARATVRRLGVAAAVAILAWTIRDAVREWGRAPFAPDPGALVASVAVLAATYVGLAVVWGRLMGDLGARTTWRAALRTWSLSNLGRYVPGKVWQIAGAAVIARDLGLPAGLSVLATLLSLAAMIGTGVALGACLAADTLPRGAMIALAALPAGGLAVLVAWPPLLSRVLARTPRSLGVSQVPAVRRVTLLRLVAAHGVAWFAQGVSLAILAGGIGAGGTLGFARFVGAYALSHVAGLLALFAPGGLGVREAVLGWLLDSSIPQGAHLLAVSSRLAAVIAEGVVVVVALACTKRGPEAVP
jgi:hypothetical protein